MRYSFPALLPLLLLCACGSSVRDSMGLTHRAPDEFRVVSRPPLSVPPEFNLRPPAGPGESGGAASQPMYRQAESLVRGDSSGDAVNLIHPGSAETAVQPVASGEIGSRASSRTSDTAFLQKIGAANADPSIRQTLQQENGPDAEANKSMLDKIRNSNNEPVVNAEGESERLKTAKEQGKAPTEGDTPMAKPKDTGTLGRIFGY